KIADTSPKNDNFTTSNSFSALNDEEEYDENMYDEPANLVPNTNTDGSSSFTAAAELALESATIANKPKMYLTWAWTNLMMAKYNVQVIGHRRVTRNTSMPWNKENSKFESGGASESGGCGNDEESVDAQEDEDEDGDGDMSVPQRTFPSDLSLGKGISSDKLMGKALNFSPGKRANVVDHDMIHYLRRLMDYNRIKKLLCEIVYSTNTWECAGAPIFVESLVSPNVNGRPKKRKRAYKNKSSVKFASCFDFSVNQGRPFEGGVILDGIFSDNMAMESGNRIVEASVVGTMMMKSSLLLL
ncbi:hypothetical protein Tco_1429770, partial [Tanacetum coccineum]